MKRGTQVPNSLLPRQSHGVRGRGCQRRKRSYVRRRKEENRQAQQRTGSAITCPYRLAQDAARFEPFEFIPLSEADGLRLSLHRSCRSDICRKLAHKSFHEKAGASQSVFLFTSVDSLPSSRAASVAISLQEQASRAVSPRLP